ncbi:MAG: hypothetical protein WBQ18_18175, partial [Solirubrobacteraceae bacterium]
MPAITGTAKEYDTLTASTGKWTNAPTSYAYQWQRCNSGASACSNISGATHSTYLLLPGDVGATIRASVNAANVSGSASATSAATGTVGAVTGDPIVVAVGDIAQPPGCSAPCEQSATAALARTFNPAAVFVLGDNQYDSGAYSEYTGSYDLSWGQDFNSIVHPVPGNHEYLTSGA